MKKIWLFTLIGLTAVFVIGCNKTTDEENIQTLLEESQYIGESSLRISNDSTITPQSPANPFMLATDTFPIAVKWSRNVVTPITWNYNISVTGDSADVTITVYFHGGPGLTNEDNYGFFVDNAYGVFQRSITDSALQEIKLANDENGWHIVSLTAANIYTVGSANPITITNITATVARRNYTFTITDPSAFYTKSTLPTFEPNDTIEVAVTLSVAGDSAWAFLHHGAGHRPGFGLRHHHRDPFYRDNVSTFQRSWIVSADSIPNGYGVRHAAVDVVSWQALFGDSTGTYHARVWALPYIVKTASQEIPPDTISE